jgi:hypothetical protein
MIAPAIGGGALSLSELRVGYWADKAGGRHYLMHPMTMYRFVAFDECQNDDIDGTDLPDDEAARVESLRIVSELKETPALPATV